MSDRSVRLEVDQERCVGHGRCYAIAPDLFAPHDEEGRAEVRVDVVTGAQADLARRAAMSCPEAAVILDDIGP